MHIAALCFVILILLIMRLQSRELYAFKTCKSSLLRAAIQLGTSDNEAPFEEDDSHLSQAL